MADSAVLNSEQQRIAQEDQGDDQSSHYASMYGGSPGFSGGTMQPGGYGDQAQQGYGSPGYSSGVMPKRDYGFEEYVSHHFGAGDYDATDRFTKGPYAGMSKGEAYEKMRDDYANMSPEDRAQWERKTFEQNDRSPTEMRSQGFQYSDQTNQWGNKSAPNQSGQNNGYSSGVSSDQAAVAKLGPDPAQANQPMAARQGGFTTPALPSSSLASTNPGMSASHLPAPSFSLNTSLSSDSNPGTSPFATQQGLAAQQQARTAIADLSQSSQSAQSAARPPQYTPWASGKQDSNIVQPVGGSMAGPTGTPYVAPSAKPMNATPAIPNPPPAMKVTSQ